LEQDNGGLSKEEIAVIEARKRCTRNSLIFVVNENMNRFD